MRSTRSSQGHRGMDRAVKDEAVALVVVGPSIIPPDIEIVGGRTEEELAYIIERLGVRIGDAVVPHRAGR